MIARTERLVYLGLGSNVAPRLNLERAYALLNQSVKILGVSRAWETPAIGQTAAGTPMPDFFNAAMKVSVFYSPVDLKHQVIRPIEARLGRVRTADKNASRTIDIDILVFDGECLEPLIWEHAYLAVPLSELLPDYTNPNTGETLLQIAARLIRSTPIRPRPEVMPGSWGSFQ